MDLINLVVNINVRSFTQKQTKKKYKNGIYFVEDVLKDVVCAVMLNRILHNIFKWYLTN